MTTPQSQEPHTGPIRTPLQLLSGSLAALIIPITIGIGLASYIASGNKTSPGASDLERSIAQRIQKVGSVEVRDANRPLQTGEQVYKAQCASCHANGLVGAPKFGDTAAWAPRIKTGFDSLVQSALKGKNAMAPQGGGAFSDIEVARAVAYMTHQAGANFPEPEAPAAK